MSEAQPAAASARNRQAVDQPLPHQRDIRTVLVKEERTLALHQVQAAPGSRRMRWNVEPVDVENTYSPRTCWRKLSQTERSLIDDICLLIFFLRSACSRGEYRFGPRLSPHP